MRKIVQLSAADAVTLGDFADWVIVRRDADGTIWIHTINAALIARAVNVVPHASRSVANISAALRSALGSPAGGTVGDAIVAAFGEDVLDVLR